MRKKAENPTTLATMDAGEHALHMIAVMYVWMSVLLTRYYTSQDGNWDKDGKAGEAERGRIADQGWPECLNECQ